MEPMKTPSLTTPSKTPPVIVDLYRRAFDVKSDAEFQVGVYAGPPPCQLCRYLKYMGYKKPELCAVNGQTVEIGQAACATFELSLEDRKCDVCEFFEALNKDRGLCWADSQDSKGVEAKRRSCRDFRWNRLVSFWMHVNDATGKKDDEEFGPWGDSRRFRKGDSSEIVINLARAD